MKPSARLASSAGVFFIDGEVWAGEILGLERNSMGYLAATYVFGGIVALLLFRVITWDLWGKKRLRRKHNGRWVGAWVAALTWINFLPKEMSITVWTASALLTLTGYLIGFTFGYVWRRFVQPLPSE
ncbi:MAG: hypothetical protein EXR27_00025 [Betaproteobacteria bacterium]|nr:hypothetical protein [Betaproteobacteria bacterium]